MVSSICRRVRVGVVHFVVPMAEPANTAQSMTKHGHLGILVALNEWPSSTVIGLGVSRCVWAESRSFAFCVHSAAASRTSSSCLTRTRNHCKGIPRPNTELHLCRIRNVSTKIVLLDRWNSLDICFDVLRDLIESLKDVI